MKKHSLVTTLALSFILVSAAFTQQATYSAKNFYDGIKNKSVSFDYNQRVTITGILKEKGTSTFYNSAYLLISDSKDGFVYVKAVLADKTTVHQYIRGQAVKIDAKFYQERANVIVLKDAKALE